MRGADVSVAQGPGCRFAHPGYGTAERQVARMRQPRAGYMLFGFPRYCFTNSTRRFFARPASEPFSATGLESPEPDAASVAGLTPF